MSGGHDHPTSGAHDHAVHECPGCPWGQVAVDEQHARKIERVRAALARFPELPGDASIEIVAPPPMEGYRTRAKLMAGVGPDRRPRLGLYAPGTHDVVDEPACRVLAPVVAAVARKIRAAMEHARSPSLIPSAAGGALEAIDVREVVDHGERCVMLTLVMDPERVPPDDELEETARTLRRVCPEIASIAINLRGTGPQVLGASTHVIAGPSELRDRLAPDAPFTYVAHGAFVQAHRATAAAIHEAIAREVHALGDAPRVIELHAGSGALALRLAAGGARVLAVESFEPAIERARRAADEQRIGGLTIQAADAAYALASVAGRGVKADAIVLDPPRRGVPAELRASIARVAPARVLYVSCDPDTLARDLAHLARLGYAVRSISALDMMPLTPHVEALAILVPAPIPAPRVIFEDERLLVIAKDPHEPTTPSPEHATSLLARVRALPGAEAAVPIDALDAGTSGLCLFVRAPDDLAPYVAALRAGRKSYVALVRGITNAKGIVRRPLREEGRSVAAITRYARRAVVSGHSLVRVTPEDERTHQVRRHLASIGHEVLGDARYGHAPSNRHLWERAALDRPFLHCERIELVLPGAEPLRLEAPLAPDLTLVLDRLRGGGDPES